MRVGVHLAIVLALTALTQLGGLAWAVSRGFKRPLRAFVALYGLVWVLAVGLAPLAGRQALPCFGAPLRAQSLGYCIALRHFVTPDMAEVAHAAAAEVATLYPGTVTLTLDAGLPFFDGFPLLPHLSHDDGEKLDFAFYYTDEGGTYLPGKTRSPVGYWAMETPDIPLCPPAALTMRWGMGWLQPLWPDRRLDPGRTRALVQALAADGRVGKIFVEPPLAQRLGLTDPKIRFQGCRAARHDDHIHVQL